jgi:hypothetical protein
VAAKKIFPAEHIFVIANGNSPIPLDNTEEICRQHGVNHVWSPVGSKIVAQYVGCYAAKRFANVLLIDDDCALPPNFPIVSDQLKGKVMCIGYTIKSVGPNSSKGTLCQQAQDLEYKISGLQRALAGKIGSATFPHGAISLWNTAFLIDTFRTHPGYDAILSFIPLERTLLNLAPDFPSPKTGSLAMQPASSAVVSKCAALYSWKQKHQVRYSFQVEVPVVALVK